MISQKPTTYINSYIILWRTGHSWVNNKYVNCKAGYSELLTYYVVAFVKSDLYVPIFSHGKRKIKFTSFCVKPFIYGDIGSFFKRFTKVQWVQNSHIFWSSITSIFRPSTRQGKKWRHLKLILLFLKALMNFLNPWQFHGPWFEKWEEIISEGAFLF